MQNICIYANIAKYSMVKRAFPSVGPQLHMSWSHGNRKVQTVPHILWVSIFPYIPVLFAGRCAIYIVCDYIVYSKSICALQYCSILSNRDQVERLA